MELLNILIFITFITSLLLFLQQIRRQRELKRMITAQINTSKKHVVKIQHLPIFKRLKNSLNLYFKYHHKSQKAKLWFWMIIGLEILLFLVFALSGKYVFAIAFPLTLHFFALKVLELLTKSIHDYIEEELPVAMKHFIKVLSRTSNLKDIMYELSKEVNSPLKEVFQDISRKMVTENKEVVLLKKAEEIDNIWFYSFTFLLINYQEQSKKVDIVSNLTTLITMMRKEKNLKEKAITEKKFLVVINYALLGFALLALPLNLTFNKYAHTLFFGSAFGMIVFIVGIWACVLTVVINLMMSRYPQKR